MTAPVARRGICTCGTCGILNPSLLPPMPGTQDGTSKLSLSMPRTRTLIPLMKKFIKLSTREIPPFIAPVNFFFIQSIPILKIFLALAHMFVKDSVIGFVMFSRNQSPALFQASLILFQHSMAFAFISSQWRMQRTMTAINAPRMIVTRPAFVWANWSASPTPFMIPEATAPTAFHMPIATLTSPHAAAKLPMIIVIVSTVF